MNRFFYCCFSVALSAFLSNFAIAQIGGEHVFEFLNLPPSAKITSLGGVHPGLNDSDLGLIQQNPAALNPEMHQSLSLNTVAYLAGINSGYLAYAYDFDSLFTLSAGLQYISYGKFDETDATGAIIGDFSGGEYNFSLAASKIINHIRYGVQAKFILSSLAGNQANGIAFDLGAIYSHPIKRWTLGLVVKNLGSQLKTYEGASRENLPFDIQAAFSKRLKYLPFRISVIGHHLHEWDIRYDDPNAISTNLFEEEGDDSNKSYFIDNLFRHINFAAEVFLGKAVTVNLAYSHLRNKEMNLEGIRGLAGFSFGAGVKIKKVQVNYGAGMYSKGSMIHHFSLGLNFNKKNKLASMPEEN